MCLRVCVCAVCACLCSVVVAAVLLPAGSVGSQSQLDAATSTERVRPDSISHRIPSPRHVPDVRRVTNCVHSSGSWNAANFIVSPSG